MNRKLPTLSPDQLADRFSHAVSAVGATGYNIPLTALGTSNILLGAPGTLLEQMMDKLTELPITLPVTRRIWQSMVRDFPYLRGNVDPLLGWIDHAQDHEIKALAGCFGVLARCDVPASFERVDEDLLGPVYSILRGKSGQQAMGAFYTPTHISRLISNMVFQRDEEGDTSIIEPCCGSAGMIVNAIRTMREAGRDPDSCTWVLNDLDPTAVALAGVNMASHGIEKVVLTCGDTLLMGTGYEGDPLLDVAGRDA